MYDQDIYTAKAYKFLGDSRLGMVLSAIRDPSKLGEILDDVDATIDYLHEYVDEIEGIRPLGFQVVPQQVIENMRDKINNISRGADEADSEIAGSSASDESEATGRSLLKPLVAVVAFFLFVTKVRPMITGKRDGGKKFLSQLNDTLKDIAEDVDDLKKIERGEINPRGPWGSIRRSRMADDLHNLKEILSEYDRYIQRGAFKDLSEMEAHILAQIVQIQRMTDEVIGVYKAHKFPVAPLYTDYLIPKLDKLIASTQLYGKGIQTVQSINPVDFVPRTIGGIIGA